MFIRCKGTFPHGYSAVIETDGRNSEMLMDFGVLNLRRGDAHQCEYAGEQAFLLLSGKARLHWLKEEAIVERSSLISGLPSVLHVPAHTAVNITALSETVEFTVHRAENSADFGALLYEPEDILVQTISSPKAKDTTERIIRTAFDDSNAPFSQLALGEIINLPGKWSSYPPHYHSHPEIYHYRFSPAGGFGFAGHGDDVYKVANCDTLAISPNVTHPQVAAPGYTMFYVWVMRHLADDRFRPNSRIYEESHAWLQS